MDFHIWMLLPLIPLLGIGFAAVKLVRLRRRSRPFLDLRRSERLRFARLILGDASLPHIPRVLVAAAAGYLALPVDLIPDFLPIIGHADDFLVVSVLMALITRMVPPDRFAALILEARDAPARLESIPV